MPRAISAGFARAIPAVNAATDVTRSARFKYDFHAWFGRALRIVWLTGADLKNFGIILLRFSPVRKLFDWGFALVLNCSRPPALFTAVGILNSLIVFDLF